MSIQQQLQTAVRNKNLSQVRYLIEERGAHPNELEAGWRGQTPLLAACSRAWRSYEIAAYLVIEKGVDVNIPDDRFGVTPLHWAVVGYSPDDEDNLLELVKLISLGNGGAEALEARDRYGRTPLHVACEAGRLKIIQYLVEERHADVQAASVVVGNGSLLRFVFKNPVIRIDDIFAYLVPKCNKVDRQLLLDVCNLRRSPMIKRRILGLFVEAILLQDNPLRKNFSFEKWPLHGIFYCPLPSQATYRDWISRLNRSDNNNSRDEVASILDDQGRLALHVAIEAFKRNRTVVTPSIVRQVLQLEPRASLVRDQTTGFFPFEAAAACFEDVSASTAQEEQDAAENDDIMDDDRDLDDRDDDDQVDVRTDYRADDAAWLDLVYLLLRPDPGHLLRRRGL